jgi:cysteine-rich repeat protein
VTHEATLLVPGTPAAAKLGTAIRPFGSSVYVGAPGQATSHPAGAVHEFDFAGTHLQTVVSPAAGGGHGFGSGLVVKGASIFVGAPVWGFTGQVYERDINTGALVRTFTNPNAPPWLDRFGHALSMAGDQLLVGSPTARVGSTSTGLVHIYHRLAGSFQRTCQNPAGASVDAFGWALAVVPVPPEFGLPSRVLVGAPAAAGGSGRVYLIDTSDCSVEATLTNPLPGTTGAFGTSVAVAGGRFVVGAPADDRAFVFSQTGSLELTLVGPDAGSQFGQAVAGLGSNVLVGAPLDDATSPGDTGVVFLHDGGDGTVAEAIVNPLSDSGASFGASLAVSGSTFFVGAPTHDPSGTGTKLNSGAVTVHTWTCGNGVLDAGETCDDGNTLNDDCCSSVCQQHPDGTACSDGNQCTVGDVCQSGACDAGTCLAGTSCVGLCGSNWICDNQAGCQCVDPSTVTTSTTSSTSTSSSTTSSSSTTTSSTSTTSTTLFPPDPGTVAPPLDQTVAGDLFTATAFLGRPRQHHRRIAA